MKVAFDTNVLISAYSARGLSADVFRLVLARHEVVLSDVVLAEFDRVLKAKFAIPASVVSDFIEELNLHHVQTTSSSEVGTMDFIRDPDDRVVVSRALSAGASVLLTGDRDILDVREQIAGLSVYTPRDFWESLRAEGE